ncbi:MAG: hypothetical protein V4530_17395 [Pseudomonadota bacterium]
MAGSRDARRENDRWPNCSTSIWRARATSTRSKGWHGYEIARYREERGRFDDLRQLDEVPGLSGKVSDAVKARLKI